MVTEWLGKIFKGINIARQRVWENHSCGTESPDEATGCLEKKHWTLDWKKNSVKSCTRSLKQETPHIYGTRCNFDQQRKSCFKKSRYESVKIVEKRQLASLKNYSSKSSSTAATRFFQLPTYTTTGENSQKYLPSIRFQCSTFVEIEYFFPSQETMYNYNKSVLSTYDPPMLAIHSYLRAEVDLISNCGPNVKRTVSLDGVVHLIHEEIMVTFVDFECGITFLSETPTKIRQINREWKTFPDPVRNPNAIPGTINITVVLMSSIALISVRTRTIYWTWFRQLLYHSTTLKVHTLCSISTLNQQLNKLEQNHNRCSLQCEPWTIKGRDCASALHSFKEITYRTDDWTKQLQRLKSWVISRSPEQCLEFHRLWWTVIVFKCSYLLQLFDLFCLLVQYLLLFFENLLSYFFSLMTLSEKWKFINNFYVRWH